MAKKNPSPSKPKLRVRKELLKRLSDDDLDQARGGGSGKASWSPQETLASAVRTSDSLN